MYQVSQTDRNNHSNPAFCSPRAGVVLDRAFESIPTRSSGGYNVGRRFRTDIRLKEAGSRVVWLAIVENMTLSCMVQAEGLLPPAPLVERIITARTACYFRFVGGLSSHDVDIQSEGPESPQTTQSLNW